MIPYPDHHHHCVQGVHLECGKLEPGKPRWKCPLCKNILAGIVTKPVSVFTKVRRGLREGEDNKFQRKLLENLSFRVTNNNEVNIDVFTDRNNLVGKEAPIATFLVHAAVPVEVPLPVKVFKEDEEIETKNSIIKPMTGSPKQSNFDGNSNSTIGFSPIFSRMKSSDQQLEDKVAKIPQSPQGRPITVKKRLELYSSEYEYDITTSTPVVEQIRKKRKTSLPLSHGSAALSSTIPRQSSILNFFQYDMNQAKDGAAESNKSREDERVEATPPGKDLKIFQCDSCDKKYKYKGNLVRHLKSQHTPSPSQSRLCSICKENVLLGDDYKVHMNLVHSVTEEDYMNKYLDSESEAKDIESDEMTVEDSLLSMKSEKELGCTLCQDPVMIGDDYRCHLKFSHGIDDEEIEQLVVKAVVCSYPEEEESNSMK